MSNVDFLSPSCLVPSLVLCIMLVESCFLFLCVCLLFVHFFYTWFLLCCSFFFFIIIIKGRLLTGLIGFAGYSSIRLCVFLLNF